MQSKGPKRIARLPKTPKHLVQLKEVWSNEGSRFDGLMFWAAKSLCFFDFMCSGELTIPSATSYDEGAHLSFNNVAVDGIQSPRMLRMHIKASKTDPFRVGVNIYVGRTGNLLCLVSAVLHYMVARRPGSGPFFKFEMEIPFVQKVQKAGVDCTAYSGHSFRSGAATAAAKQGVSDATIQ